MKLILESRQPLHNSSSQASYGVSLVKILEKTDRIITTPHCNNVVPFKCPCKLSKGITTRHWTFTMCWNGCWKNFFDGLLNCFRYNKSINTSFKIYNNSRFWMRWYVRKRLSISAMLKYTQPPLNGFHCLNDSYSFQRNISGLSQAQAGCVRQCLLLDECTILMYNPWDAVCVLGSQPCAMAVPHSQLMTMVFRREENLECLIPKPVNELNSGSRLITIWTRKSLARLERGGNIFVGSGKTPRGNDLGFFWFDGEAISQTTDHVLLTVSPWCSVAWLKYTVGEPIPPRAMLCGKWNDMPVYTLRRKLKTGTYKFSMYVIGYPIETSVSTDILIRVWHISPQQSPVLYALSRYWVRSICKIKR